MNPVEFLVASQHERWLKDPITIFTLVNLREREAKLLKFVLERSVGEDVNDARLRLFVAQLQMCRLAIGDITDTVGYVSKQLDREKQTK